MDDNTKAEKLDQVTYQHSEHHTELISSMKSMYDNQELTDVTLQIENVSFACHKNVLAAVSPYFRAMFMCGLQESTANCVELHEVDPDSLRSIIDYAYTGAVSIHQANAQNLLAAASLFQIMVIQKACAKFIEKQIVATNCAGIYSFASIHRCHDLSEKAKECIKKSFLDVCVGEEFFLLSGENLKDILTSDDLIVESEEVVFESLMKWINHDIKIRKEMLCQLLPNIRFALLNSRYIQDHVISNKLINTCEPCQVLLRDFKQFEINPETYNGSHEFNILPRSRKPENCILFISGDHVPISCYNPETMESYFLPPLPSHSSIGSACNYVVADTVCVVTEDNLIFATGGKNLYHASFLDELSDDFLEKYEYEACKDFFQYDNDHNTWKRKGEMRSPMSNSTLAAMDGFIYCFGGFMTEHTLISQEPVEFMQKYDIARNEWDYAGVIPYRLADASVVMHDGLMYILGGWTGVDADRSAWSLNPRSDDWIQLAYMAQCRFKFGATVFDNEIYVAGGQVNRNHRYIVALRSVEIYSISENKWRWGPELPTPLFNVSLVAIGESLYAAGIPEIYDEGYNIVYKLDMTTKRWEQIVIDLGNPENFCCVVAKVQTRKLLQVCRPTVDT